LKLLIDSSDATGSSAIELKRVPMEEVSAYGVVSVAPGAPADGPFVITDVVEKPQMKDAPSDLIILGRYVLTPQMFEEIANLKPVANGEYQLTDALLSQTKHTPVLGHLTTTERYDTGTPFGWLTAVIDIALRRDDVGPELRGWLQHRLG
jgi:UTP--glucose-1-phosphate uridylyltransferase